DWMRGPICEICVICGYSDSRRPQLDGHDLEGLYLEGDVVAIDRQVGKVPLQQVAEVGGAHGLGEAEAAIAARVVGLVETDDNGILLLRLLDCLDERALAIHLEEDELAGE